MRTFKIHLIRHGLTEGNSAGAYIGKTDLPLSAEGVRNLKNLKEKIDYPFAEKVYCSPLLRCRQTANILYPEYNVEIVDNLSEYDFGEFEGKTYKIPAGYEQWLTAFYGSDYMQLPPVEKRKRHTFEAYVQD